MINHWVEWNEWLKLISKRRRGEKKVLRDVSLGKRACHGVKFNFKKRNSDIGCVCTMYILLLLLRKIRRRRRRGKKFNENISNCSSCSISCTYMLHRTLRERSIQYSIWTESERNFYETVILCDTYTLHVHFHAWNSLHTVCMWRGEKKMDIILYYTRISSYNPHVRYLAYV